VRQAEVTIGQGRVGEDRATGFTWFLRRCRNHFRKSGKVNQNRAHARAKNGSNGPFAMEKVQKKAGELLLPPRYFLF
jgi:hypothetical protein